jgi:hypothetical protein
MIWPFERHAPLAALRATTSTAAYNDALNQGLAAKKSRAAGRGTHIRTNRNHATIGDQVSTNKPVSN